MGYDTLGIITLKSVYIIVNSCTSKAQRIVTSTGQKEEVIQVLDSQEDQECLLRPQLHEIAACCLIPLNSTSALFL